MIADLVADANAARPITAGGTGGNTAAAARTALAVPGLATENVFTKTQIWAKGADVASAAALNTTDDGNYFDITGTTTVTSIVTVGVGAVIRLHFDGALILTHHATDLILPGGADITTVAGDEAEFIEYATGDWRCVTYQRNAAAPYSTGTFTPTYRAGGVSTGVTYTTQTGSYTKTGRLLYFTLRVTLSNAGSAAGAISFGGLPFSSGTGNYPVSIGPVGGVSGLTGALTVYVSSGSTAASVVQWGATGTSAITQTSITNTADFIIAGCYEVAQ